MGTENEKEGAASSSTLALEATQEQPVTLRPEQVEALLTISTLLNSDLKAGRVLRDILVQICSLFRADRAAVFLREKLPVPRYDQDFSQALKQDIGKVVCVASTGLTEEYLGTIANFYEKKEFRQIQSLRRPIYIADARQDYRLNGLRDLNRREGFQTMLTLPMLYHETLIGTLVLYHDETRSYTPEETRLLTIFASQAALALTNARLYEAARRREREAALLSDAGRVFNATLKTREVLNRVVRAVGEMIGNTALVYIVQEETDEAFPVAFYSKAAVDGEIRIASPVKAGQPVRRGEGIIGKALQTDMPFLLQDKAEIVRAIDFISEADGVNSLLCVPLKTRGRIIGALLSYQVAYEEQGVRRLEEDQLGLAQALADRAAVAIENARLYEAEKREQRVKDEFLTLVSHELNTPLTNIKGFNHLLAKRLEDALARYGDKSNRAVESLHHYTEIIGGQIERLQTLIGDLGRIPQIEGGQLVLKLEQIELLPLLKEEIAQFEKSLQVAKGGPIQHNFEIIARHVAVQAQVDRIAFGRIIQNLLSNAVKFWPGGGLIRLELSEGPGHTARVAVIDQGLGISMQDQPHIFERFYKTSSHPGRANGLGLGLYISRSLAEAMDGTLTVNSEEGRGSTFILLLKQPSPFETSQPSK